MVHEMVHPLELGPHETFAASAGVLAKWWWRCRRPSLRLSSDEGVSAAFTRNKKENGWCFTLLHHIHQDFFALGKCRSVLNI